MWFCTYAAVGILQKLQDPGAQNYKSAFVLKKKKVLTVLDSLCLWILNSNYALRWF